MKKLTSLKLHNHGFGIVEAVAGLVLVVAIIGVGFYVYTSNADSNEQASTGDINKEQDVSEREAEDSQPISKVDEEPCRDYDEVRYCLEASRDNVPNTEFVELSSTITNISSDTLTYSFGCASNDPAIYVNGEPSDNSSLCATSISEVDIEPGEMIEYSYDLWGVRLQKGENKIQSKWSDFESNIVAITRQEDPDEAERNAQECLEGQYNPTCKLITVLFERGLGDVSCEDAAAYVDDLEIQLVREDRFGQSYCPNDDLFFARFYAPGDDIDHWLEKLNNLEEVEIAGEE